MRRAFERRFSPFIEIGRAAWQNKRDLGYAWRILKDGVCDGCALGTSGMKDWTMPGIHLCWIRLNLLRLNTMPAIDTKKLHDLERLKQLNERELRQLGRIPYPLIRHKGENTFARIHWDQAIEIMADRFRLTDPKRFAFYLVSRGTVNETYYAAQKVARFLGSNHIDNSARICHAPSTVGLQQTIGHAATTCSYSDLIGSDWVVFFGSNAANNQPVMMKYLAMAKDAGTKVAIVNPYLEPGMQKYWVPSNVSSAILGTTIADACFQVKPGGDIAFIHGVLKELIERQSIDESFIQEHTQGWADLRQQIVQSSWQELIDESGLPQSEMVKFADLYAKADTAIFVWSMGITMHRHGVDNVKSIVNLALSKGMIGKKHTGLMPIRGHSGVQGGAEMGAVPNKLPGGLALDQRQSMSDLWGFDIPDWQGDYVLDMIERAADGKLDALYCVGSNLMDVLPDSQFVKSALERIPLRIHHDILLNQQMFLEPADTVLILPATTRYEMVGGNTETSTERRVIFNPEIPGKRITEARDEWRVLVDLASCVDPSRRDLIRFKGTAEIRAEISASIPVYEEIKDLERTGDQFQWGGNRLCEGGKFNTPDGKAQFSVVPRPKTTPLDGQFMLSTRRGKQFNSMTFVDRDNLAGATRDQVILSQQDLDERGWSPNQVVKIRSAHGSLEANINVGKVKPGMAVVYWPICNSLMDRAASEPHSGMPAFRETRVDIEVI